MRTALAAFAFAAAFTVATLARAGDLIVEVRGADGRPVADAVATLKPIDAPRAPGPIRFPWPLAVTQQNIQFDPFVLIVPVGADVAFPNKDRVRHHVYSFSPAKTFQLKLYSRDESRTVKFDKAGIVALGCNIHDQMIGFIDVVDTPWAAKTSAAGAATLVGAPGGRAVLTIWHPYLKGPKNQVSMTVTLPRDGAVRQAVSVTLVPPPPTGGRRMF